MKLIIFLSTVIAISLLAAMPSSVNSADLVQGIVKLSETLTDGTTVKVEMRTMKIASQSPYRHAFRWGGDETVIPKKVITVLDVQIRSENIFVPLSAYSDLGDPHKASLEKMKHGFKLIITGGDAAVSYKAVLLFDNENIQSRKVTHGEFPDEVWEETVYSFISKNDDR